MIEQKCLRSIEGAVEELGRVPTAEEYRELDTGVSMARIRGVFGQWRGALWVAGYIDGQIEEVSHGKNSLLSLTEHPQGYLEWSATSGSSAATVGVHQLLACLNHDPHEVFGEGDTHVHHRAGHPKINIEGYVEVLPRGKHQKTHNEDEWTEEDGIPVLVTQE